MSSRTVSALTGLPFENIIGSPLDAAIKAQAMSANTTIAFIKEVGFRQNTENDKLEPLGGNTDSGFGDIRYVNFAYEKKNPDGTTAKGGLKVPILTIVPIPMLRIEEMTIDFSTKISESTQQSTDKISKRAFSASGSGRIGPFSVKVSMSGSSKTRDKSSSKYSIDTSLDIHVRAVGDSMPAGLSRILGILEANMIDDHSDNESVPAIPIWKEGEYAKDTLITHGDGLYISTIEKNSNEPGSNGSNWKSVNIPSVATN